MEMLETIARFFAPTPEWVPLFALPALLFPAAALFARLGKRRGYPAAALGLGALGVFLTACGGGPQLSLVYAALFAAVAALASLFLLLPAGKRTKRDRERETYEKFRIPLDGTPASEQPPAKVCASPAEESASAEACGLRLSHAKSLLGSLRAAKLSASDRLEADALERAVEGYGTRALTQAELDSLNDCLASVLKLTAKYKL